MEKEQVDFQLLLRIRQVRADIAARSLAIADQQLKHAQEQADAANTHAHFARQRVEKLKADHNPQRKKYITGADLMSGVLATERAKAELHDASRHHEQTVSDVRTVQRHHLECLRDFRDRQRRFIKTEAALDKIRSGSE